MEVRTTPVALEVGAAWACVGCGAAGASCALRPKGTKAKSNRNRKPIGRVRMAIWFGKRPWTL